MRVRVVIGIVVGVVVVCWLVIPHDGGRRQHNHAMSACINHLRLLESAKEQFALEKRLPVGAAVEPKQLQVFWGRDDQAVLPRCPAGDSYTLNPIGQLPTCSIEGHVLAP